MCVIVMSVSLFGYAKSKSARTALSLFLFSAAMGPYVGREYLTRSISRTA